MANLVVIPAQVVPNENASPQRGTAGTTIAQGDIVYLDANRRLQLSDADGAVAAQDVKGMAVCGGSAGQWINYITEDSELVVGENVVEGTPYFLSATAGKMCEPGDIVPGMRTIFLGVGKADGKLNFKPVAGGTVPTPQG